MSGYRIAPLLCPTHRARGYSDRDPATIDDAHTNLAMGAVTLQVAQLVTGLFYSFAPYNADERTSLGDWSS
jgi:hypothetical protein